MQICKNKICKRTPSSINPTESVICTQEFDNILQYHGRLEYKLIGTHYGCLFVSKSNFAVNDTVLRTFVATHYV